MPPPVFPPVRPMPTYDTWGAPQTLTQRPRLDAPQVRPILGAIEPPDPGQKVRDPWHIAMLNGSQTISVPSTRSVLVIAQPPTQRNLLILRNISTVANIYVDFGNDAATNRTPLILVPGSVLLLDTVVPQDDVNAIADAANGVLGFTFSNI